MARTLIVAIVVCVCALTIVSASASASSSAAGHVTYPLFKQCDPRWGKEEMGTPGYGERATICREGCAMSSLAMALAGFGVDIDGKPSNPGTLNKWLEANEGYDCVNGDCNNLVLNAVQRLTPDLKLVGDEEHPALSEIIGNLTDQSQVLLAHVHDNHHYVLLTGWDPESKLLTVNDPFYNSTTYPYDQVSDVITYTVMPQRGQLQAFPPTAVIPFQYPLYKQCNVSWGSDIIETTTICAVGCLMSSTSMAIHGKHIPINGQGSNPGTLNTWLRANGGYTQGNDLIESVVPKINPAHISWPPDAMHPTNDIPMTGIRTYLEAGRPVIANVMHGHHFVLVIGYDKASNDTLYVNDPGFNKITYSYSEDVVGWRLFAMSME